MKKKPKINVSVIKVARRPFFILRWIDQHGDKCEESSKIPKGETKREYAKNYKLALDAAKQKEQQLSQLPEDELSIDANLESYETYLNSQDRNRQHIDGAINRVKRIVKHSHWTHIEDINGADVSKFFQYLKKKHDSSNRTINSYLESIKAFSNWLVQEQRLDFNPVAYLRRINTETDRRRQRRALTSAEFSKLITSATNGPTTQNISGPDRAMIYILACWTGYRAKELASLKLSSFDFNSDPATVSIDAKSAKNRKRDQLPLHPVVLQKLKDWIASKDQIQLHLPIFPLKTPSGAIRKTAKMMKGDLERAGIAYQDDDGLFADFHANRYTFITNLGLAGVPLSQAQKLARHSDPRLTANIYTQMGIEEKSTAINQLPPPPMADQPSEPTIPFDTQQKRKSN